MSLTETSKIRAHATAARALYAMFDIQKENQQRQMQLAEELNTAYKANRKKRFENKMLTYGLMIMSGITTTLFIKSQQ